MSATTAEECIRKNDPAGALQALKEEIRKKPADGRLRAFLFQLYCVSGDWEKALTQLHLCEEMKVFDQMAGCAYGSLLQAEAFRQEVFAGKRQPLFLGEPAEWAGKLVQAQALTAKGEYAAAAGLRGQAFEEAPANPGRYAGAATEKGTPAKGGEFAWFADGDSRLGPCLEVVAEGKYYWLPLSNVSSFAVKAPAGLSDLVWAETALMLKNGGNLNVYMPVRYPGAESDGGLLLARRTEWTEKPAETWLGRGQRLFMTDAGEAPLFELGEVTFS